MKLYNYWRSSASWRVRLGLAYKNIPYEYVSIHIAPGKDEQLTESWRAKNPMAQVPMLELELDGVTRSVTQSIAILEMLEELHPENPLLPKDTYLRAKARQLAEAVNSGIQPFQNLATQAYLRKENVDDKAWTVHFIDKGLLALEQSAQPVAGDFMVGDAFSIADACLLPQLYTARRFEVSLERFPTLLRAEASCAKIARLEAAHPSKQPDAQPT